MDDEAKRKRAALQLAIDEIDGKKLTGAQQKELAWLRLQWFFELAMALPMSAYLKLACREHTQIMRQAKQYHFPITGNTVDLFEALRVIHDWIAKNGRNATAKADVFTEKQQAETRMLELKIQRAEIDNAERMNQLIDRSLVREKLAWLAKQFRVMAESIGRRHGSGPQQDINDFLDAIDREFKGGKLAE